VLDGGEGNDAYDVENVSGSAALNGGDGNDAYTVRNLSGSAALNGGEGSDDYTVFYSGTGAGTTTVSDSGVAGIDSLNVNGTAINDAIALTANQVTRSSETINNGGTENLTVDAAAGEDSIAINSAIAPSGNLTLVAETITSTEGSTVTSGGADGIALTAETIALEAPVTANGGSVTAIANTLTTDDITAGRSVSLESADTITTGDITAGRGIDLTSENGSVRSGDLTTTRDRRGGPIEVSAANGRITTGAIDSSSGGTGGDVSLDADGNIRVVSINTEGANPQQSGDVEITTNGLLQVTGGQRTQGLFASISAGDLSIQYDGREERLNTFRVGNANSSGTAGALTTGTTRLTPLQFIFGERFELGNITIVNLNPFVQPTPRPPTEQVDSQAIEQVDRRPAVSQSGSACPIAGVTDSQALNVDTARDGWLNLASDRPTASTESCLQTEQILQVE
jgi:hypothetical protein